jgi:hypothetical protein
MIPSPGQSRSASPQRHQGLTVPHNPSAPGATPKPAPAAKDTASPRPASPCAAELRSQKKLRQQYAGNKRAYSSTPHDQGNEEAVFGGITLGDELPSGFVTSSNWVQEDEEKTKEFLLGLDNSATAEEKVDTISTATQAAQVAENSSITRPQPLADIGVFLAQLEASNSKEKTYWKEKKESALERIKYSVERAGQQAVDAAASSVPATPQSNLSRQIQTALNEACNLLHGLSPHDMSLPDQALFVATMVRDRLAVPAYEPTGQACMKGKKSAQVQRTLGHWGPASKKGSLTKPEREARDCASAESSQLSRLAIGCANEALGSKLEFTTDGSGNLYFHSSCMPCQRKLHALSIAQGPQMVAYALKLYESTWVAREGSDKDMKGNKKTPNPLPKNHFKTFVDTMLRLPAEQLKRFQAAAHNPEALERECKAIKASMHSRLDKSQRTNLDRTLERVQGHHYELRVHTSSSEICPYANAPPAIQALNWLKSMP